VDIGFKLGQRLIDPFDRLGEAVADLPVLGDRARDEECRFGAGLGHRPTQRLVDVVDLCVEAGQVLVASRAPQGPFGSLVSGQGEVEPWWRARMALSSAMTAKRSLAWARIVSSISSRVGARA
jgi:hypothetical protein